MRLMKTRIWIFAFLVCSSIFQTVTAQHEIRLKNGKTLKDVRLHEIRDQHIIYEKRKSLHDLEKHLIDVIETDTAFFRFKPDGSNCVLPKSVHTIRMEECSIDHMQFLRRADGQDDSKKMPRPNGDTVEATNPPTMKILIANVETINVCTFK